MLQLLTRVFDPQCQPRQPIVVVGALAMFDKGWMVETAWRMLRHCLRGAVKQPFSGGGNRLRLVESNYWTVQVPSFGQMTDSQDEKLTPQLAAKTASALCFLRPKAAVQWMRNRGTEEPSI